MGCASSTEHVQPTDSFEGNAASPQPPTNPLSENLAQVDTMPRIHPDPELEATAEDDGAEPANDQYDTLVELTGPVALNVFREDKADHRSVSVVTGAHLLGYEAREPNPQEQVRRIQRLGTYAACVHGINGDVHQFPADPPAQSRLARSAERCHEWLMDHSESFASARGC
uniref:Uncharacterized protein n=1 Tax=Neobodo designis TaxID=312471 RepID=A0A6U4YC87_NEODS|mmetsp:Transcript_7349/g.22978  ORF Transcript_7349/g.22978 Transcript_7349/m.22978 type:complete len:170 (+) Transcript_7349:169-678(+)